jgi:biopolymer transport protein ExbD
MKYRRKHGGIHIDMTPMVDVMMLLVIFFMMSTTFLITHPGFNVNLPKASAAVEQTENITVLISKEGQIVIGEKAMSLTELSNILSSAAVKQPVVYVKADKDVRHGVVIEVMDEIHKAGISKISVAVEPKGK